MTAKEIIELCLLIGIILLLVVSQLLITATYNKYSNKEASLPTTGKEVVENMLNANAITDVELGYTNGTLDDHYNHKYKTINLSKNSYKTNSVAAIAVAAHETGHAVQDHTDYFMLKLRKFLGPICVVASKFVWVAIFIGIILQMFDLIVIGLVLMGITILFQLITLPVEFDASRRAVQYLETVGYDEETMTGIRKMLRAAAFTYVASTLASLMQMIRLILNLNRKD